MEPTESRILQRALLYMRTDRADLAINGLKRVTGMGPNNAVALSTLGTLLLQQDRATEALPYLERAMALRPQDAETAYNVGVVRLRVGRNDDALEAFRAAAAIDATMHAAQQGVYAAEAAIASSSAGGNPTAASGLPTLKVQRQTALESRTNEQALLAMTTTTRRAPLPKLRELQAEAPAVLPAYPLAELAAPGPFPEGVDPKRREVGGVCIGACTCSEGFLYMCTFEYENAVESRAPVPAKRDISSPTSSEYPHTVHVCGRFVAINLFLIFIVITYTRVH